MENVQAKQRPILVWIIVVFYGLSCAWMLILLSMFGSSAIPLAPAQEAYYSGLTDLDYTISVLVVFTGILGAGALFELKKIAFTLFQISLAVNVLYTLWTLLKTSSGDALPPGGLIGMISGLVVVGLIVLYVYRLKQRGVLE